MTTPQASSQALGKAARNSISTAVSDLGKQASMFPTFRQFYSKASSYVESKFKQFHKSRCVVENEEKSLRTPPSVDANSRPSPRTCQPVAASPANSAIDLEHLRHADSYAEYLHWGLIPVHEFAQQRLKQGLPLDVDLREIAVFRIRGLAAHPFVQEDALPILHAFADLPDATISSAAKHAVIHVENLHQVRLVAAKVVWLAGDTAVARFLHPQFGMAEREFALYALPAGIEVGNTFLLQIDRDEAGKVCGYIPRSDLGFAVVSPASWENIPRPTAPKDLDNAEQMAAYQKAMNDYMATITELRAKEASEWLSQRRKADKVKQ